MLVSLKSVLAAGLLASAAQAWCVGHWYLMVGNNDGQIEMGRGYVVDSGIKVCQGTPINIWYESEDQNTPSSARLKITDPYGDESNPSPGFGCERNEPFALYGDDPKANFFFRPLEIPGLYEVIAELYTDDHCKDMLSTYSTVTFEVVACTDPEDA